jgi:hypothetical protein
VNIEAPIRERLAGLGIPAYEQYETYRGERQLFDMLKSGLITEQQANDALRTHKGPVWDQAVQAAALESGVGSAPLGAFAAKAYPHGEEQTRALSDELNALVKSEAAKVLGREPVDMTEAWDAVKGTPATKKGGVISEWYDKNPAYTLRQMVMTPEAERQIKFKQNDYWDVLGESIPSYYTKQLTKAEQDAKQKWYDVKGDLTKLTPEEQKSLDSAVTKLKAVIGTPEFVERQRLGKELQSLIESEFAKYGGPEGVEDKYKWLKDNGHLQAISAWYKAHPGYSTSTYTPSATTGGYTPSTSTGVRIGSITYYPTAKSGGGRSYTKYTSKAATTWAAFKKVAPAALVKALSTFIKKGQSVASLGPDLWRVWTAMGKPVGDFDTWLSNLLATSGLAA